MKSLFKSWTFWFAIAQGVLGGALIVFTELEMGGLFLIAKTCLDVILRLKTTRGIDRVM